MWGARGGRSRRERLVGRDERGGKSAKRLRAAGRSWRRRAWRQGDDPCDLSLLRDLGGFVLAARRGCSLHRAFFPAAQRRRAVGGSNEAAPQAAPAMSGSGPSRRAAGKPKMRTRLSPTPCLVSSGGLKSRSCGLLNPSLSIPAPASADCTRRGECVRQTAFCNQGEHVTGPHLRLLHCVPSASPASPVPSAPETPPRRDASVVVWPIDAVREGRGGARQRRFKLTSPEFSTRL